MNFLDAEEARIDAAYRRRAAAGERYSSFEQGHLFMVQQLERRILAALRVQGFDPLHDRRILEVGCGSGYWLRQFIQWGARPENLAGVDLMEARVAEAKSLSPAAVEIRQANAAHLNFADKTFDLVFQATVFTSILDRGLKTKIAAEMIRVTKADGIVLWYDFRVNNPWNRDVRGVKQDEIRSLFPGCSIRLRPVILAPPVVRRLAPYAWMGCCLLEKVPWLCTHYLGVIRKTVPR